MEALFHYFRNYQPLSEKEEKAVAAISRTIILKKNEELQPIGHTCKTLYFITKGIARILYYKDGNDITESFAFENNIIARVESLFSGKPSRKAIEVLEDTTLVAID